jgi:hypothetical protein
VSENGDSGWTEISREREMSSAQERAREALALRGIDLRALHAGTLRLDVGLDENKETYYRVRVLTSVFQGTEPES